MSAPPAIETSDEAAPAGFSKALTDMKLNMFEFMLLCGFWAGMFVVSSFISLENVLSERARSLRAPPRPLARARDARIALTRCVLFFLAWRRLWANRDGAQRRRVRRRVTRRTTLVSAAASTLVEAAPTWRRARAG